MENNFNTIFSVSLISYTRFKLKYLKSQKKLNQRKNCRIIWSWTIIAENNAKNEEKKVPKYETLDELIALLIEVRVDLTVLCKSINSEKIKEEIKWAINGIDIVGCGLSQNIKKKLKEK